MTNKDILKAMCIMTFLPILDGVLLPIVISTDKLPVTGIVLILMMMLSITVVVLNHYVNFICETLKYE